MEVNLVYLFSTAISREQHAHAETENAVLSILIKTV